MFHFLLGTTFRLSGISLMVCAYHIKHLQCGSSELLAAVRPLVPSPKISLSTMFHFLLGTTFRLPGISLMVCAYHIKHLQCGSSELLAAVRPLVPSPNICLLSYR